MSASSAVLAVGRGCPLAAQWLRLTGWALGFCAAMLGHATVPESEALQPPAPGRLAELQARAQREGWTAQSVEARGAALLAYERERFAAADAWINVARWAELFGEKESVFIPRWLAAVRAANVAHAGMPRNYTAQDRALGAALLPELQGWLLGNAPFSREFFSVLSPLDYVPEVFRILATLHHADRVKFESRANLALAIAVVYDVPPPPFWPHGQVSGESLPRKLPAPADAFAWWIRQEKEGNLHHLLPRFGAAELKFVVDAAAPLRELEWSQRVVDGPLRDLPRAYTMVRYRTDRIARNDLSWSGKPYRLMDILADGGICVDQAYFAAQAAKARGVPSLLIYGAGNDGRHAWFGFLDSREKWQLDCGRTPEQKFVTGLARDPQTWGEISDHELQFLSEGFRGLPPFHQSRAHATFARDYLKLGKASLAAVAARKAVGFERRNQEAWETLLAAAREERKDAKTIESLLREAATAFQRYPDLEAGYLGRVAESLRGRGQVEEADQLARHIAAKFKSARGDLSVQQAREMVQRGLARPAAEQMLVFNAVLENYGRGGGMAFFDKVVVPFVTHLMSNKRKPDAIKAVERARQTLRVESNSQLASEFERLKRAVQETN